MNNIQGIPTANVDWSKLVDTINNAGPLSNIEKASFNAESNAVTITTAGDNPKTVTISVPDLDSPGVVTQSELDSFIEKLSANDVFNFTDDQIREISEKLHALFEEALKGSNLGVNIQKGALFDVYQLAALMLEVSQKQRDASREIRQAENEAIQQSILNQAEMQRSAALTGMIAGLVVCAVQVAAQGISIFKSSQAYGKQSQVAKDVGVKDAQLELKQAKADLQAETARVPQSEARIEAAKERVAVAEQSLTAAENRMNSHSSFLKASHQQMKWRALGDIFAAMGSTAQGMVRAGSDLMQAEATEEGAAQKMAEEQLDQIKDLFNQSQEVINKVVQLMSAVIQAETQSMRDAIHA